MSRFALKGRKHKLKRKSTLSPKPIFPSPESMPGILPKLLVFDLDNTLWTPELYQIRQKNIPTPGKEIDLFPDAKSILIDLANNPAYHNGSTSSTSPQTQFAIASRTHKRIWADSLLKQFQIRSDSTHHPNPTISLHDLFPHKQIVTGSKKHHFQQLQKSTGIPYRDMVFFDDDMHLNCFEVAQLGVLCCHCPRGITVDLFRGTLMKYYQLKRSGNGHDDDDTVWMGYTVTIHDLREVGLDLAEKND